MELRDCSANLTGVKMNIEENLVNDPWGTIYWCSRNNCDLKVIGKTIAKLLMSNDKNRYKTGLEILKAVKSQLQIDKQLLIIKTMTMNIDPVKILEDTTADKIVIAMTNDYNEAMGLITLLEIYPLLGLKKCLASRILETISLAIKTIKERSKLVELLRAIIYGPISVLSPVELFDLINNLDQLGSSGEIILFKSDLLMALSEIYPPKYYEEFSQLTRLINKLLREVLEQALIRIDKDLDFVIELVDRINLFKLRINRVCSELGNFKICEEIFRDLEDSLNELYSRVGKFILMTFS